MKNIFFKTMAVLGITTIVISCGKDKPVTNETGEVITQKDGILYKIDIVNSRVEWKGYKVLKADQTTHFGIVKFESGELTVKNNKLQSGKFVANINSLENVDLRDDEGKKTKLEGHLKSADFFNAEKFPTVSYEITKVADSKEGDYNTIIDGNLTIKGITKHARFKANVNVEKDNVSIATEPTDINRKDFDLNFEIPLENGLLNKEINIQVLVKAMKSK